MELEFQQVQIPYLRNVLFETLQHEESGEAIVPDTVPDMDRIVDSFASVVLRGKECQDGAVSLTGDIQAGVLFLASGEEVPRLLPVYLPFTLRRSVSGGDGCLVVSCGVRSVDARMLHSRKVGLRVGLCITLRLWQSAEQTCFLPANPDRRVQLKQADYPMRLARECAEKTLLLRDSLSPGAQQPEAQRILHCEARCELSDEKLSGSQAVCKGAVRLDVLYETPELELCGTSLSLPFSQLIDLEGSYEEQGLEIVPVLTSVNAAAEDGQIAAEAGVCLQCLVTQTVSMPLVEDAYATRGILHAEYHGCCLQPQLDSRVLRQELRSELPVSAAEVIRAEALPDTPALTQQDGQCRVRVPVLLRVLYRDGQGQYCQAEGRAEMTAQVPAEQALCRAEAWADGVVFAAPAAGRIELRVPMALRLCWYDGQERQAVCALRLDEGPREERPAVIIRTLEEDVPLWDIAKELRTTVSAIRTANDLDGELAPAGAMLLIPIVA